MENTTHQASPVNNPASNMASTSSQPLKLIPIAHHLPYPTQRRADRLDEIRRFPPYTRHLITALDIIATIPVPVGQRSEFLACRMTIWASIKTQFLTAYGFSEIVSRVQCLVLGVVESLQVAQAMGQTVVRVQVERVDGGGVVVHERVDGGHDVEYVEREVEDVEALVKEVEDTEEELDEL